MKNKILTVAIILIVAGSMSITVFAENDATPGGLRNAIRNDRSQFRNEVRQERHGLIQNIQNLKLMFGRLFNATVTGISGSTITVTDNGKIYTVLTDSSTIFRRHFWGKSSLSEIKMNDKVNVWGKYTDSTKTSIQAHMIRDLSIMKRFGVFFGTINTVNGSTITLNTLNRGAQTVSYDSNTKCVQRNMQPMNCTDIQAGQKIRVRGMWDAVNKTISEVSQIKNFSVPIHPSVTSSPTL